MSALILTMFIAPHEGACYCGHYPLTRSPAKFSVLLGEAALGTSSNTCVRSCLLSSCKGGHAVLFTIVHLLHWLDSFLIVCVCVCVCVCRVGASLRTTLLSQPEALI